jgi:hypothetical protein
LLFRTTRKLCTKRNFYWGVSIATSTYFLNSVLNNLEEYGTKLEGLRRLKKHFYLRNNAARPASSFVNELNLIDFYLKDYVVPMAVFSPRDLDEFTRLLATCNQFGIGIGVTDVDHMPGGPKLQKGVDKPFVLVDIRRLDYIVSCLALSRSNTENACSRSVSALR